MTIEAEVRGLDLPSGDPLALLTLRERCVFVLRAYRFPWTDIARLLRTKNRTWLYECARRAQGKLERRVAGRSFGIPERLTPGGLPCRANVARDDEDD